MNTFTAETMEDSDGVLKALRSFNDDKPETLPSMLETYIARIASTGETLFQWHEVKGAFIRKMHLSMEQFIAEETHSEKTLTLPNVENVSCDEVKQRVLLKIEEFVSAPFTIQRLAELLMYPQKHYKKAGKWLRGLEKNVNVVSTVDPFGTKIVNESKLLNGMDSRNGMDDDTSAAMGSPERTLLPPPPVNSPATSIPGWFNIAGNGDGWSPARSSISSTSTSSASTSSAATANTSADDSSSSSSDAPSGCVPMQNGTKRLKTHHIPSGGGGTSSSGASAVEMEESGEAEATVAAAAASGEETTTDGEGSNDSQSLSEPSDSGSTSPEPSDAATATSSASTPDTDANPSSAVCESEQSSVSGVAAPLAHSETTAAGADAGDAAAAKPTDDDDDGATAETKDVEAGSGDTGAKSDECDVPAVASTLEDKPVEEEEEDKPVSQSVVSETTDQPVEEPSPSSATDVEPTTTTDQPMDSVPSEEQDTSTTTATAVTDDDNPSTDAEQKQEQQEDNTDNQEQSMDTD